MTPRGIIFSDEDRAKLAAFDSGNEIRPGRILAEIDTVIDRGIMEGRFTREAVIIVQYFFVDFKANFFVLC